MILANWKGYLLAGLILSLLLMSVLLQRAWNQVAEKIAEIDSMRREATVYRENSEKKAKEIGDEYTRLVATLQSERTAVKNAQARFGSCNRAHGVRADWVQPKPDSGQADSAESVDGAAEERVAVTELFINDCAADAARVNAWRSWAVEHQLEVK